MMIRWERNLRYQEVFLFFFQPKNYVVHLIKETRRRIAKKTLMEQIKACDLSSTDSLLALDQQPSTISQVNLRR